MRETEYELLNHLCGVYYVLMQTVLFLVIWDIFLRGERKRKTVIAAGVFIAVNLMLHLYSGVPSGMRYVISAVLVFGYCYMRYEGYLEKAFFTLSLFYNFHAMSFLISGGIYHYVTAHMLGRLDAQDSDYLLHIYRCQMVGQVFNLLFYTICFLIVTVIVRRIVKSPFSVNRYDAVFLSTLNVVGGMLAWMVVDLSVVPVDREVFLLFDQKKEMIWRIPMIAALICIGEISAVYIFQKYKRLQEEREKHFVEQQQMKAMKRRLEEAENFYGSIRKVRHEIKNHITNIKGLVAGEKYGEAETYIGMLDETMQALDYKFSTGNAVTDVIINDKYQRAKKAGILFRVRFEYRETDTIPAFDMGIILNNLLDNAIEACQRAEPQKRHISLALNRKNHFLLIEVENGYDGGLEWRDGDDVPATMKLCGLPDICMEHGIGLKNVRDVAERYLGYMDIKAGRDVFKVTVMLQQGDI